MAAHSDAYYMEWAIERVRARKRKRTNFRLNDREYRDMLIRWGVCIKKDDEPEPLVADRAFFDDWDDEDDYREFSGYDDGWDTLVA